jgi:general secretion pathway protein G
MGIRHIVGLGQGQDRPPLVGSSNCRGHGPVSTSKLQVRELVGVAQEAMIDEPSCPTIEQMVARGQLRKVPRDAWGTPLTLECPSKEGKDPVDVTSAGPDKKPGTEDDIKSWQL